MGLTLGRYLREEADCVERLNRPGADAGRQWELVFLDPAFVDQLRKADRQAIAQQAEEVLERVVADYGDVPFDSSQVAATDTLAAVAKHELSEIRSLSVGRPAPEIEGKDVDGKPMKLSEFRGKVVLLDFGSHEHCGGCKVVYPRLRATLDRLRGRPFAILGINNFDSHDKLKEAIVRGEITWPCWWDGDKPLAPRPDHHELEHSRLSHLHRHRPPRRDPLQERHPSLRPVVRSLHRVAAGSGGIGSAERVTGTARRWLTPGPGQLGRPGGVFVAQRSRSE